jgi:hypothetical protein
MNPINSILDSVMAGGAVVGVSVAGIFVGVNVGVEVFCCV